MKEAELLAAIAAAPEDDAPRLVWADWLSERGDPRGELVVAQCALERLDRDDPERAVLERRAWQLTALHGRRWADAQTPLEARFARGFVDSVDVRWVEYEKVADSLFAISPPLRELRLVCKREDTMDEPERVLDDPRLERLRALDLSDPRFRLDDPDSDSGGTIDTPFGARLVARLQERLPNLRSLTMREARLSSTELELLARLNVTSLDLGYQTMQGGVAALLSPGALKQLRKLKLDYCSLHDAEAAVLAQLPLLEELDLANNRIGAKGASVLANLQIARLDMASSPIGDEGAAALAKLRGLVSLRVSACGVGNDGAAALADLELTSLDLENNLFDETGVRALVRGRIASSIQRLRLGTEIGSYDYAHHDGDQRKRRLEPGVAHLLAGMPRLWEIDLRGCYVDGDGAVALLDALPSLRSLRLGQCRLGDAGLAKLVAHPRFSQIDTLELDRNKLGPDAGEVLARAPQLPTRLLLYGNDLGDAGAGAIADAPAAARIIDLDLQDNEITDDGARSLVERSAYLDALALLHLAFNPMSDGVAKVYQRQLGSRFTWNRYWDGDGRYWYHRGEDNPQTKRRAAPAPAPVKPPVVAPAPRTMVERPVAEPPNASLTPGEKAIVELVIAGRKYLDTDNEGSFREFLYRDGRFVQVYGSYAYKGQDGATHYEGPKSFLRDLLATCYYERAHSSTDDEFLEKVRKSIAGD